MYNIQSFSSLIEVNNANLANSAGTLINGLKILNEDQWYICGGLVLNEGDFPRKSINSSPDDLDYKLLMDAALLVASTQVQQPITLTVGFPNNTYKIYRKLAINQLLGSHTIVFDSSVFVRGGGTESVEVEIQEVDVLPEIVGCNIALREGEEKAKGKFFALSCGFGTFESVLSTEDGIIEQTMESTHGLRYAINLAINELEETNYLEFRSPHLLNDAFQKGYIILNRKVISLKEIRRKAITTYYNEIISPCLKTVINDANLMKTNVIYLCGGGIHYEDLANCFVQEFGDIAELKFVEEPESLAAKGYLLNSISKSRSNGASALGIDIGNSNTRIASLI
jgi:hypothetical protein